MKLKKNVNIKDFFSIALLKYGKTFRSAQLEMALQVNKACQGNNIYISEAEVGTGKTYAYLVPSLKIVNETKKPFLISTATISLQEQLLNKDIPDVSKYLIKENIIAAPIEAHIGKGKEHYICEKRLTNCKVISEELRQIKNLYNKDKIFDRSNISIAHTDSLWRQINVRYCNRNNCPVNKCLYRKYKNMQDRYEYDLLVCNHQYLLACCKDTKTGFLSNFSGIIIDEVHNLEAAAYSIFGWNKSLLDMTKCFERIEERLYRTYKRSNNEIRIKNINTLANGMFMLIKSKISKPKFNEIAEQYNVNFSDKIKDCALKLDMLLNKLKSEIEMVSLASKKMDQRDDLYFEIENLCCYCRLILSSNRRELLSVNCRKPCRLNDIPSRLSCIIKKTRIPEHI